MKYHFVRVVFVILCIFNASASSAYEINDESGLVTLNMALSLGMPASGFRDSGEYVGFEVDMIEALIDGYEAEVDVKFIDASSWKRSLDSIQQGRLDLLTLVSFREDRVAFMDYIGAFNTEVSYLITREDVDVGELETLDDLAIEKGFIYWNRNFLYNVEFEERIKKDPEFASYFTIADAEQVPLVANVERNRTDDMYRKVNETRFEGVYEYGSMSCTPLSERISLGTIGACITVPDQMNYAIREQEERIMRGGAGVGLKGTMIKAFGASPTYLVASRKLPDRLREHMKMRYREMRSDGSFEKIWLKWYGDVNLPDAAIPAGEKS